MIELTYATAFTLYLALTLTGLLGLWFYSHCRTRKKVVLPSEQELFICEYCHFAYLEEAVKPVTQCPQCQSFNKHNLYRLDPVKSKKR